MCADGMPITAVMSDRSYRRATRYALVSVLQLVVLAATRVVPLPSATVALLVTVVLLGLTVLLIWSWGFFFADVAMNEGLDERERLWWRVAFCVVPGGIALYWFRQVRPFRLTA
jgi:hypothetical protein